MKAILAQVVCCVVYVKDAKIMETLHGIIPYMFNGWADPVVQLLLLKSSMASVTRLGDFLKFLVTKFLAKVAQMILKNLTLM